MWEDAYIDCPDKNTFIMTVCEMNESFTAFAHESGKEQVERAYLWPVEEVVYCIWEGQANMLGISLV